jgi:hypothetical protein
VVIDDPRRGLNTGINTQSNTGNDAPNALKAKGDPDDHENPGRHWLYLVFPDSRSRLGQ